ncbi:Cytochrome P450 monooxygenase [Pseudocercospora fuligena]|uniref:Cytochrome P450 monooxygenase n=1 Tax=Pseudocercospora fuligena TaxID=685502 RepID=A0A8H6VFL8_9PEZI|nr:Cytochrome P450 monooxygenase [Pseudocercospora fuligena]
MALVSFDEKAIAIAFGAAIVYCLAIAAYRLFFHPLSTFPGPKLAACTLWYEFYYDVVLEGQWTFRIQAMHEKYGPIVRINPHELHIRDPDFYQAIYAPPGGYNKRNKYQWFYNMAAAPGSIFSTVDHDMHRIRRKPLDNFFSKKAVMDLEPTIREKVEKLSDRLAKAAEKRAVVRIDCAFMALTMDIICSYCFGSDRKYLDNDDFGLQWKEVINGAWQKGALIRAFPWMVAFMSYFPRALANKVDPDMGMFLAWQDSVKDAIKPILDGRNEEKENGARTIFHTLRDSDLPPQERTLERLSQEGEIFTGAGSETTAKTLTTILYYLVTHPRCMAKLKDELRVAMPESSKLVSWTQLEQLPYLTAVIQEGLRLSHGITSRLPRVATESIQYKEWYIPAGTPVSETIYFVLTDSTIFPDPDVFRPERWLDDGDGLRKYQVSFNIGSRQCIGQNLAYAEMYMATAALFSRFSFDLHDTTSRNVAMEHDFFVAAPAKQYRGVKACVTIDLV